MAPKVMLPKAKAGASIAKGKAAAKAPTPRSSGPKVTLPKVTLPAAKPKAAGVSHLKQLQTYVRQMEMKIDDLQEEIRNTNDRKELKVLQASLKKLETDPKFIEAVKEKEILEIEEKKKAAMAVTKDPTPKIPASSPTAMVKVESTSEAVMQYFTDCMSGAEKFAELKSAAMGVGSAVVMELGLGPKIDEGLASKDAKHKSAALRTLQAFGFCAPISLVRMKTVISLFGDKSAKAALDCAKGIIKDCPKECIPHMVLDDVLIAANDNKKWKIKAAALSLLAPITEAMAVAPKMLAELLSQIIPVCVEASREIRQELRDAAQEVLNSVGRAVANPEIKAVSEDIIKALVDPTDQKLTQDALMKLGSTTFMNYVDANGLAILEPILSRALREREQKSKKWAAQIFGACIKLVKDIEYIVPYLPNLLPQLKNALIDPTPEVQREAAKTFGQLCMALPEVAHKDVLPFLRGLLSSKEENERTGAAAAFAQVYFVKGKDSLAPLLNEAYQNYNSSQKELRHSYLEILDILPALFKEDYAPHIIQTTDVVLRGCHDEDEHARDAGMRAATSMISYFGPLCPEVLFPAIRDSYLRVRDPQQREVVVNFLGQLVSKMLDHKKYGQDMLSLEIGNPTLRKQIAVLMYFIWKGDEDGVCVRAVAMSWKSSGGAPKMLKECIPQFVAFFNAVRKIENRPDLVAACERVQACLVDPKVCTKEDLDAVEVTDKDLPVLLREVSLAVKDKKGRDVGEETDEDQEDAHNLKVIKEHAVEIYEKQKEHLNIPGFEAVIEALIVFAVVEAHKRSECRQLLESSMKHVLQGHGRIGEILDEIAMAAFPTEVAADEDDGEELLRIDDMMLMYGGGQLLLTGTTLRLCKGRRYGVIGHNGAGKTTLMKQLASGKVANMPKHIKCVHVSDAELGDLKVLEMNAVEFIKRDAPKGLSDSQIEDALEDVDFPKNMQDKLVSDMSGGWRMRLILARAMLKNADVYLLDEPTNHLDVQAIAWLEQYLVKQSNSSMLIISHEPSFLNTVCTDIMQYKDKKLHFYRGDFDAFQHSIGLRSEDVAALLKGDINLDTAEEKEDGEDAPTQLNSLATTAKLTFPIPGKLTGISSSSKAVMTMKNVKFSYDESKGFILKGVDARLTMGSRVAIVGRNGAGKSTLMGLLCRELNPTEVDGEVGEVWRHHNMRLAYIAQHHMETLGKFYNSTPFQYLQHRFQNGYDEELQKHLLNPKDEEEALLRKELGKKHGKYGLEIGAVIGRTQKGKQLLYEVQWAGMTDTRQNTWEPLTKFRQMGVEKFAIACDERIQAQVAGLDQKQVTRREAIKHLEQFGIDEEMCCNRNIGSFSAGQKSKLALGAAFWTKPHLVALDEPTNYLDPETVASLARALKWFRGGVVVITHNQDFIDTVCNESWLVADGKCTVSMLDNDNKRLG